jgi:hypothetical protein
METKLYAIDRYLNKNLSDEHQVLEFFEQVVTRIK